MTAKWDSIVGGKWFVPAPNATAYFVDSLGNHAQAGFQNVYNMRIVDGRFVATTVSAIAPPRSPFRFNWKSSRQPAAVMTGDIDDSGHIKMTITSQPGSGNPVQYAVGQMIFLSGQWRMTMQVALEESDSKPPFVVQWANMTKIGKNNSRGRNDSLASTKALQSTKYSWLKGTSWRIVDQELLGGKPTIFSIKEFRRGYLFGASDFRPTERRARGKISLSGNVTPVGDIFWAFTAPGGGISEAYGRISGSARHPGSFVLKDVVTGEVLGHADYVDKNRGRRGFGGGSFSGLTGDIDRTSPNKDSIHIARVDVPLDGLALSSSQAMPGQHDGSLPVDPALIDAHSPTDLFLNAQASSFG